MNVTHLTVVTLGVRDLQKSTAFYRAVFGVAPNPNYQEISFFELPGTWVSLFPLDKLAQDISPQLLPSRSGFAGITLAHNARSREGVLAIFEHAKSAGAVVAKAPQDTFWGGFSGYFADPDGYHWEVVWGPMFEFTPDGSLRSKP